MFALYFVSAFLGCTLGYIAGDLIVNERKRRK